MTFHLRGNGGNHAAAEWIAAEGEIADDTEHDLEAFVKSFGHRENQGGWRVRFNSPGGSLAGGIKLGEAIRKLKLHTEIGRTEPDGLHWKKTSGICASACAFAFLGGLSRDAASGELGVHQFYNEISLRDPSARVFSSLDMSEHQFISAILIDYAFRLGVDPRIISLAASTPPNEMQFLDEQALDDLNVRWFPRQFRAWTIEPCGLGVIAVTYSNDATRAAKFSCVENQLLLTIENKSANIDANWLNNAMTAIKAVSGFDHSFPKDALKAKIANGALTLQFALPGIDGDTISSSKWSGVGVEGPRYMWGPFTYEIPKKNIEAAIKLVLKNPI
jgi:hypothetical protein